MRVADYVIDFLYKKGASYIFTLAGGGAMFLNDAVAQHKKIKYICCHHEQACAMAAEAYAKTNNKLGAVMVTSGPGSTNTITGLMEAYQNSIPVFFISSQAKRSQMSSSLRQFGVQEVDIISIVNRLTKYAAVVERPENIRFYLETAYFEAKTGRPGPVWLDIPLNVAAFEINPNNLRSSNLREEYPIIDENIEKAVKMLKSVKKPVIVAGGGIRLSNAVGELRQLVETFKIQVVTPHMGVDLFEFDHPYYVGTGGVKGQRAANIVLQNADLILSIGSRLAVAFTGHEYSKFAPKAKKIVVDIDRFEHLKKTIKIDLFIEQDAKVFIKELLKHKIEFTNKWMANCQELKYKYYSRYPKAGEDEINIYDLIGKISKLSRQRDIYITDAGTTTYVLTQAVRLKKDQRIIVPGATLAMGYNLPAIVGTYMADPQRIICITGDGSFQTNIHELQTIIHHKIPAKIFVTNNGGYQAIRNTQRGNFNDRFIGESATSGISFPSLEKITRAYGIKYFKIKDNSQLEEFVEKTLNYKGTVICEVICPFWQDVVTVSSKRLPDGRMVSLPIDDMAPFLSDEEKQEIAKKLDEV